jgi:ATP-dependent Clp protease adapter protein ClpS
MNIMRKDGLRVTNVYGIPIFIHWTFFIGGLFISVFADFKFPEIYYYCIAYVALITIHELGHVISARALGLKVYSVQISGLGGECRIESPRANRDIFLVYSSGLLAQVMLFGLTYSLETFFGPATSPFSKCVVSTFITVNAIVFFANLIPRKVSSDLSTDGHVLWSLFRHAYMRAPHPLPIKAPPVFPAETSLLSIESLKPDGFSTGIEILNDNTTPMEFVVDTFVKHFLLQEEDAILLMLTIHNTGGLLYPLPNLEEAECIAAAITADAQAQGYQFICRAVDANAKSHAVDSMKAGA